MKLLTAVILTHLSIASAYAETYNYSCKACIFPSIAIDGSDGCEVDGKAYPLRVDEKKNVLKWRGKNYKLSAASADDPKGCANYGWHAEGNGKSFTFCAATQGYGAIEDQAGEVRVQCSLKR